MSKSRGAVVSREVNWDFMFDPPAIHEDDDCSSCHEAHVSEGDVAKNALEWPAQFKCCVDEFEEMKADDRICARHPLSYFEAANKKTGDGIYCEACVDSVKARFAYYVDLPGDPEWKPEPSYFITASDHPKLPVHGNVGGEQLLTARVDLPLTPSYETWVAKGRPVYRGEVTP
jgi:hypothetical protein